MKRSSQIGLAAAGVVLVATVWSMTAGRRSAPPAAVIWPRRYRSAIAVTRWTRLPRLLARSTLYFSSKRSHVKSPSDP